MLLPRRKINLEEFLPHVMAMVQGDSRDGLPSNVALSYIRNAAIRFAERSRVLRRHHTVRFQPNLTCYPLLDGDDEVILQVTGACHNDGPIGVGSFEDNVLRICYTPNECDIEFEVMYVVKPTRKACAVDELLYEEWHDAIVAGALSDLHLMPQQPWTSGQSHLLRRQEFERGVAQARIRRWREGTDKVQRAEANQNYVGSCGGMS